MRTSTLFALLLAFVLLLLGWYELVLVPAAHNGAPQESGSHVVTYFCDEGMLTATYASTSVTVLFPSGTTLTMPRTMAASGVRYEASSTVFWTKGEQAFVTIGDTTTYNNCVAGSVYTSGATSTYTDATGLFRVSYPSQFILSGGELGYTQSWSHYATTSGMRLVKIVLPASFQEGTNLGDSQFTIGASSDPAALAHCLSASDQSNASSTMVTLQGVPFAKFTGTGAGAGNLYETTSYRTVHQSECYAVEYVVHSLNIGNFPPERNIKPFDENAVHATFEAMVQSFQFLQ